MYLAAQIISVLAVGAYVGVSIWWHVWGSGQREQYLRYDDMGGDE
jgi:hypothetical protein